MRATTKALAFIAAGSVLCCFGVAFAQDFGGTPPGSSFDVSTEKDVNLPLPQMLARARAYKPMMDTDAASVQRQASEAKQKHDVVRSLCLSDKLSQIHVAVNTAGGRIDALAAAVGRNEGDRAKHEFTIVQVLKDRTSALVAEANQCIGEETGFIGDSTVTVSIDPTIPNIDPSVFPSDPFVSEPPVLSSPTM